MPKSRGVQPKRAQPYQPNRTSGTIAYMTTITPNGAAIFRINGTDASGTYRVITGTMTTSDSVRSYVAKITGETNKFVLKARVGATAAGTTAPVDVTVNAVDDRGIPLAPRVFNFEIQGPALPPPATNVIISEGPFVVDSMFVPPPDPGSGTIPL